MIYKIEDTQKVMSILGDWQESLIWSCLQKVMGSIYADDLEHPSSAMAFIADFIFLAGAPNRELVSYKPGECVNDFVIMVPQNDLWARLIEQCYGEKAKRVSRYAIKKEPDVFHKEHLRNAVNSLPQGYTLQMIDEDIYNQCKANQWSWDLVYQFDTYEKYAALGLGAAVLKDGRIVAGASSYTRYKDGIEIEIDTKTEYRRQGLAYACGARLILECLEHKIYPSWDAQNLWSVGLAEKLGYHFDHEYTAYEVCGYLTAFIFPIDRNDIFSGSYRKSP